MRIAKAMLKYLQEKSPSVQSEWECLKIRIITEGDDDEKEFIIHSVGVQVPNCMVTEEKAKNHI